tara:strand:+ start:2745 stop:5279 length:2535 start_codon:yes stop_codon:yes gene_type:complete
MDMFYMNDMNFSQTILNSGGTIKPLIISSEHNSGLGIMNPSIYNYHGKLIVNLRAVNYTFYHSEKKLFQHPYGPLTYLHPENDIKLRTWNYYLELNDECDIVRVNKIDTSKFVEKELWEFIGLEDARIFEWKGKLYTCGVRRDLDTIGTGRMELCEIEIREDSVVELSRFRIPTPGNDDEYCSKNWMPIIDKPFHFVKWSNPTEIVKVDPENKTCETVFVGNYQEIGRDLRGGSQIVSWRDYYIAITHEVDLFKSETGRKDALYRHRVCLWDKDFNLVKWTNDFSIMGGDVEFCVGLTQKGDDFYMTYGFQDNAAYLLKFPETVFEEIFDLKQGFNWGYATDNEKFKKTVEKEIFIDNVYQKFFKVEEGDIVFDIGASSGPFTYLIKEQNPEKVYCFEPHPELYKNLVENVQDDNVVLTNKAIGPIDGSFDTYGLFNSEINQTCHKENLRTVPSVKFSTFIKENNIDRIDFLKSDCEGGEYDIFNDENLDWIRKNVRKIAGEWHLTTPEQKEKFRKFRDTYLKEFPKHEIYSIDYVDIKWSLWSDRFIDRYGLINLYIDNQEQPKDKWKNSIAPTMEFTTSIDTKNGCVVDCVFCPQRTLQESYTGKKFLSIDDFKTCVNKIPKEVRITFAGFTEPWLNPECTDMLLYAHERGHPISVFTTGIGMKLDDIERIKHIPFAGQPNGGFTLHLPDQDKKAKHPITDRYVKVVERFGELRNEIQNFNVMSMGEIDSSVKHVFSESHVPEMWSRAGNLLHESILKPELLNRKNEYKSVYHGEKPRTCGCLEKLYHNVVLPNGDVSLCCMDYGLEHIIGNLIEQDYEDVIPENNTCFNLCKFCENGVEPE